MLPYSIEESVGVFEANPKAPRQNFLLQWGQRWIFNLTIYILHYLAVVLTQAVQRVCDHHCWLWHWSCTEFPLPPVWRMFSHLDSTSWEAIHTNAFISDPQLSSWAFGASQVGYSNDCPSYPNSALQQFMPYTGKLIVSLETKAILFSQAFSMSFRVAAGGSS